MNRIVPLVALIGALAAAPVAAAEQGAIGAVSKGEIGISLTIAGRATMADLATDAAGTRSACVWLDTATHGYALTVLDGDVRWRAPGSAGTTIAAGHTLTGLSTTAAHPDCDHDAARTVGYATDAPAATPATLLIAPE